MKKLSIPDERLAGAKQGSRKFALYWLRHHRSVGRRGFGLARCRWPNRKGFYWHLRHWGKRR